MNGERAERHPSPIELERFLLGEMNAREAAPVLVHLMHGCNTCQERMEPITTVMFTPGRKPPLPSQEAEEEYDEVLSKAFAAVRRHAAALDLGKEPAEAALAEVAVFPPTPQQLRCETLLERCREIRTSDPEAAVMLATLAVTLAERLEARDPEALADFQALAWAELGNSRRVADDTLGAERDLAMALERSGRGTGDPRLLARLMDLTASLYIDQRRFDDAFDLLDRVYSIHQGLGDRHAAGRALISKGISASYALETEEAVRLVGQGLQLIDAGRDPKLALAAVHNVISFLVDRGEVERADRLLEEGRMLYAFHGAPLDALKMTWLEGLIAVGRKETDEAERLLREAQRSLLEMELPYTAALASLDLAALWLEQGRTAETRDLVEELLATFRALDIRREAIAALLMLREAFHKDQATLALLRTVASELQRLEREPGRTAAKA
ncbi:MAG TPA: hypothetical protein VJ725_02205 [Thermoanaerobaculia bacterium]|nr:hypothetical protein [Thermoanaerobaculia bacterium]